MCGGEDDDDGAGGGGSVEDVQSNCRGDCFWKRGWEHLFISFIRLPV